MNTVVKMLAAAMATVPNCQRVWLGYSGGRDSHVLLHAATALRAELPPLIAVHVHHGLSPQADAWQAHCAQVCADLDVPLHSHHLNLARSARTSLEALARNARYQTLASCLQENEVLLTAHHAEDQAETLLLQLLRGAGAAGLAAMPAQRALGAGMLLRPWLEITRAQIQAYAEQQGLRWVEDESNASLAFERNFLRHQVLPLLQSRRAGVVTALARSARHQAENAELLHDLGEIDWVAARGQALPQVYGDIPAATTSYPPLQVSALALLSPPRQRNLLRVWLQNCAIRPPPAARLDMLRQQVLSAATDSQPLLRWRDGEIYRYRGQLHVLPPLPPLPTQPLPWRGEAYLNLPLGCLYAQQKRGQGVYLPSGAQISVRFRQGGESLRINGHRHKLKKYLQEHAMPWWERSFLPLLYVDNELAVIPGLACGDDFRVCGDTLGWSFGWQIFYKKSAYT
jgi:tRNA(Ile)-lysidine synthase